MSILQGESAVRKCWFYPKTKEECEELAAAITELLAGKEYMFCGVKEGSIDIEIHMNNHLTCGFSSSDTPFYVYVSADGKDADLWMSDTYGIHFLTKDTEYVHINWGRGT